MSEASEAAAPAAALSPPAEARAARLAKFKREQLIVNYLDRGVSVAEIAAHIGVGEKRMRAVIREILARRMPHPPEEFVAIQVSRLNEAMLVAFSAMSPSNLKAVDQVVKIVRELDRYGGAFAAEWRRPGTSGLEAPSDEDAAFASAWLYGAGSGLPSPVAALAERGDAVDDRVYKAAARGDRPGNPAQPLENVESTPGFAPLSPLQRGESRGEGPGRLAADARPAPCVLRM